MSLGQWLTVVGGVLLSGGVLAALLQNHYTSTVMGNASLGFGRFAPDKDSAAWKDKERLRARAECWFRVGIALTVVGGGLQTIGALLPQK
jgi:hypothetical protein